MLDIDEFMQDRPWSIDDHQKSQILPVQIEDVTATRLQKRSDHRGDLCELLSMRDGGVTPIVHVYSVTAVAKSVRAWVFHNRQFDRLAFTQGQFRIVLYDIRKNSPSYGKLDIFELGNAIPAMLVIPPHVVHGVQNYGDQTSSFLNMPTEFYDPNDPDKFRIPHDHPGVPYSFGS